MTPNRMIFNKSPFFRKRNHQIRGSTPQISTQQPDGFDSDSLSCTFCSVSSIRLTKGAIGLSSLVSLGLGDWVEMDKEHKRKGCERNCDQEAKRRKKLRRVDEEEEASAAATEEEVEEFFAILRRMKAAIKYFAKGNDNVSNGEGWRAVEAEVAATVAVVGRGEREEEQEAKVTGEDAAEEIDLNAVPEGDINGGS